MTDELGLAKVTHRAVDQAAGVPAGTTSNYFRTRAALYEAIAQRILDQQLAAERERPAGAATATPDEVAELLAAAVDEGSGLARNRHLARFELSLEAARNPELAALMRELRAVTLRIRTAQTRAAYPHATEGQVDAIASLLTGLAFDRITLDVPAMDTTAIARAVLRGLLGPENA
jgi:AcrR family transcriptional regulator